ncbi:MAG TPA: PKD domain-containing protein, partial [Candidatus Acidoferrales bacterium]|nr:PKD domain-containing protein [Candidatus Acidoferrales bacterium]
RGHDYSSAYNTADFTYDIPVSDVYGIAETYYTLNGSATKSVSVDGMPLITEEGINVIEFWAVDFGGNVMGHDSVELYLDKSAPTGAVQINNGARATDTASVTLHLTAEDKTFIYQYRLSDDGVWDTEPWQMDADFLGKSVVDTTKAYTLPSGEGTKTVYYQINDYIGGHISETYSTTIILDTTPPTGTIEINNGAAYTSSRTVNVALSTSDLSGVEYMRFSNDNATWSDWQAYTTETTQELPASNGLQMVYCQIKDYASLITTLSDSITLDTVPPIGSIQINNDATYTTSTAVTLSLSATDATSGVSQVRFSNDNTQWSTWETAFTSKDWTLAAGDGAKTVYYQIKDNADLISNYSATITLDTTPPTGIIQINNGAQYTNKVTASLTLTAVDANGVAFMRFSNDNTTWSTWESFSAIKNWTLTDGDGTKTVYVQFRDNAGLIATYSDAITLDNTPPTGTIQINAGAKYSNSTTANLTLTFTDANGIASMRFSNDNTTWSTWEIYSTTKNWTITTIDGIKAVYVQFQDNAGLTSTVNASIILDTEAPTLYPMVDLVSLKNKQLSFDAHFTQDNFEIASFLWDFGDGSQSSDMYVIHAYSAAGNYTASLTVRDSAGNIATGSMRILMPDVTIVRTTPAPTETPTPTNTATVTPSAAPTSSPIPSGSDVTMVCLVAAGILVVLVAGGLVVWFKKK